MDLPGKRQSNSPAVRNRLLKLIIDKVELRHDAETIDATIIWETGFYQGVIIKRAGATYNKGSNWTEQENRLLETLWPNASITVVQEALPGRTVSAIRNHARRPRLKRQKKTHSAGIRRRWTRQEEARAREFYEEGGFFLGNSHPAESDSGRGYAKSYNREMETSIVGSGKEKTGCLENSGSGLQGLSRSRLLNTLHLLNRYYYGHTD